MISPFNLTGKNIIITGASSGIGRATAIAASRQGARLFLFGRNKERLNKTLRETENPDSHKCYSIELTDYAKVSALFDTFYGQKIKFDGLVNCAGISTTLPLVRINEEKLADFFQTNVFAAIHLTKLVSKKKFLPSGGSSIVFISSVMGMVGEQGKTLYGMTKGALISATKSLALELASKKIRINSISPGVVKTTMSENAIYSRNEQALKMIKEKHPLGLGSPEDVANACVFLLSDAAKWITGTNLIVDGGYTTR